MSFLQSSCGITKAGEIWPFCFSRIFVLYSYMSKKDLGDHIGKKRGWFWWELFEVAKLIAKNPAIVKEWFKKKK